MLQNTFGLSRSGGLVLLLLRVRLAIVVLFSCKNKMFRFVPGVRRYEQEIYETYHGGFLVNCLDKPFPLGSPTLLWFWLSYLLGTYTGFLSEYRVKEFKRSLKEESDHTFSFQA